MIQRSFELIRNVVLRTENAGLDLALFIQGNLDRTRAVVIDALKWLSAALFFGLLLQKWPSVAFGSIVLNLLSFVALGVGVWAYVRTAALIELCVAGNRALTGLSDTLTGDHVEFPELLSQAKADQLLKWGSALLLAISGAAAFADIFPAYKNIGLFLSCVTISIFCLLMYNTFAFESRWQIPKRVIEFAFLMLLFKLSLFVIPEKLKHEIRATVHHNIEQLAERRQDSRELEQAEDSANHAAVPDIRRKVADLAKQRNQILSKPGVLSDTDQQRADEFLSQIEDLKSTSLESTSSVTVTSPAHWKLSTMAMLLLCAVIVIIVGRFVL